MRFTFIAKHRGIWPVTWLCEALDVSRSGFHAWLDRSPSKRSRDDEEVGPKVRQASSARIEPMARAVSGETCWQRASHAACTGSSV